ncbi:hypothetical protein D9601_08575 [Sphingomonas sp. MA1305]|nr:hypothetical protein [Sphingomonas sp. MA1305]
MTKSKSPHRNLPAQRSCMAKIVFVRFRCQLCQDSRATPSLVFGRTPGFLDFYAQIRKRAGATLQRGGHPFVWRALIRTFA